MVFPESTEQTAAVVKLVNRELIPVVPRGAVAGLACGAVPIYGGIILSLEKMNKILEIDPKNMFMVVQAGTPGLKKSSKPPPNTICCMPATPAAATVVSSAAMSPSMPEATKPSNTVQHAIKCIRWKWSPLPVKSPNSAVDLTKAPQAIAWEQLVIGSEGTLGVITEITLKLVPLPQHVMDLLAVFPDVDSAIAFVNVIAQSGITPACLEFMDNVAIRCVERFINEKLPL